MHPGGDMMMMRGGHRGPREQPPKASVREQARAVFGSLPRLAALLWQAQPGLFAANVALTILPGLLPAAGLYMQKRLVDTVAAGTTGSGSFRQAIFWLGLGVAISALQVLMSQAQSLVQGYLQQDVMFQVQQAIAAKAQRLSLSYFDLPAFYDDLQRAQANTGGQALQVVGSTLAITRNIITLLSYLWLLYLAHWSLVALLVLVTVPAMLTTTYFARLRWSLIRRQTPLQREMQYTAGLLTQRDMAQEVRIFALSDYLAARWRTLFRRLRAEQIALNWRSSLGGFGATSLGILAAAIASAVLIWEVFAGSLTLGDLVALTQAVGQSQNTLQGMAFMLANLYENALATTDLFKFLALPEEPQAAEGRPCPLPLIQGIAFEGVSFRYPEGERDVLSGVSFVVRPGERIALVGENGAGKSTLVKLMLGLYRPTAGRITYDGIDLRELDPASVRRAVSVVFQNFARYDLTARENIGFGDLPRMDDTAALTAAAEQSGAHAFLARFDKGYETVLGRYFREGHELSYGQWQKVAVARAFFRDAQVVVLDEPTANLDARAEAEVFQQYALIAQGKTSLFISHRLGTARSADRIIVLRQGERVEDGHHDELVAQGGEYARMFELQKSWYV